MPGLQRARMAWKMQVKKVCWKVETILEPKCDLVWPFIVTVQWFYLRSYRHRIQWSRISFSEPGFYRWYNRRWCRWNAVNDELNPIWLASLMYEGGRPMCAVCTLELDEVQETDSHISYGSAWHFIHMFLVDSSSFTYFFQKITGKHGTSSCRYLE